MLFTEPSPFASYIGSNYVPTDAEVVQIEDFLKGPKGEKAKLDAEIAEIQAKVDALRAQSDALATKLDAHQALISPIRRYPDILQEIFVRCLPTDHDAVMSAGEPPLLLTRVCSYWRRLALATPALWSSLFVTVPSAPPRPFHEVSEADMHQFERFVSRLQTVATAAMEWLGRSGSCPLSISMVVDYGQGPDAYFENPFIDAIIPFSSRWKKLILQLTDDADVMKIARISASEIPLLQEFILDTGAYPSTDHEFAPAIFRLAQSGLVQTSTLRKVVFCNLREDFSLFILPWKNLTHISVDICRRHRSTIGALSPQKVFDIMERAVSLVSAQFEIGTSEWEWELEAVDNTVHGNAPLVLSSLRHLAIHARTDISQLLQAIRTPALLEFGFFSTHLPDDGIPEVLSFVSRATHLITFSTDPRSFTAGELLECLRLCSSITCLKFGLGFVPHIFDRHPSIMSRAPPALTDDDLMSHLTPSDEPNAYLCPMLKAFWCTVRTCFSEEALVRFVTARQELAAKEGSTKLERVIVAFTHIREADVKKELESYVESGLDLRVSHPQHLEASLSMRTGLNTILYLTEEGSSPVTEYMLDPRLF